MIEIPLSFVAETIVNQAIRVLGLFSFVSLLAFLAIRRAWRRMREKDRATLSL